MIIIQSLLWKSASLIEKPVCICAKHRFPLQIFQVLKLVKNILDTYLWYVMIVLHNFRHFSSITYFRKLLQSWRHISCSKVFWTISIRSIQIIVCKRMTSKEYFELNKANLFFYDFNFAKVGVFSSRISSFWMIESLLN